MGSKKVSRGGYTSGKRKTFPEATNVITKDIIQPLRRDAPAIITSAASLLAGRHQVDVEAKNEQALAEDEDEDEIFSTEPAFEQGSPKFSYDKPVVRVMKNATDEPRTAGKDSDALQQLLDDHGEMGPTSDFWTQVETYADGPLVHSPTTSDVETWLPESSHTQESNTSLDDCVADEFREVFLANQPLSSRPRHYHSRALFGHIHKNPHWQNLNKLSKHAIRRQSGIGEMISMGIGISEFMLN